ncbi:hypothetical protein, partial [Ralstonia solanacearum]|uniref:hypothetical protein n=1 Tax=Ralstonia solanacearum TaxID=305 RepID=UPI001E40FDC8
DLRLGQRLRAAQCEQDRSADRPIECVRSHDDSLLGVLVYCVLPAVILSGRFIESKTRMTRGRPGFHSGACARSCIDPIWLQR